MRPPSFTHSTRFPAIHEQTFTKIRDRIALAAFDDSKLGSFHDFLNKQKEVWWETPDDKVGTAFVVGGAWSARKE